MSHPAPSAPAIERAPTCTPWHCERCGVNGVHEHHPDTKLMVIGLTIAAAHIAASKATKRPCSDSRGVRVQTNQLRLRLS
jgi:hypothetical protein